MMTGLVVFDSVPIGGELIRELDLLDRNGGLE